MSIITNATMYIITKNTKAIIANSSGHYRSKIFHSEGESNSIHSPRQIISYNCMKNHSSMEGRETAARHVLRTNSKLPISVNPSLGIYLFPTTSPRNPQCVWLSYYHIDFFKQVDELTYIHFQDGTNLHISISERTLDQQYKKTSQLIAAFHRENIFGYSL
ncbi:competence protein ComK [Ornithinibacillus sp. 4-3]|uniref:Competence protein ComK n=1 Tax=Ornithinibacillus sp. 4-3 TaxID=3231488 RepID=A0AB39HQY7_9BACI